MRSKVFFAVGLLFALLSSSIATSADPIAAPARLSAGYVYTESELNAKDRAGLIDLLAGLPKQKLIDLILKQQQSENVGSNGSLAAVIKDDSAPKSHHTSKILLPLVGILAGGLAVATLSMSSHRGFVGSTNNNSGLLTASSRRRSGVREVMPFATAVSTPTSTCNVNIAFSCGPYPLHQTTCNSLAAVTTSESTFTPLLVKSAAAYAGPHILMLTSDKPPTGATVDTSVKDLPAGYTAYTLGAAGGPTGSQITFGIVGLAVHLLQVGASCTNGTAAVAGG